MKKVKFRIEYLIYLFLLLTPFLDAFSFLFRKYVPNASFSPSTFLRPIIPCILLVYIFVKDKKVRKFSFLATFIYGIYGLGHLWSYQSTHTSFNAGSVLSEAQYVMNYTYMIGLFYALYWFLRNRGLPQLRKYISIMLALYLGLIYLAIITKTSSTTYIDGVGYKGWNASGNGLSAVFILGFCSVFTYLINYLKKWYVWIFFFALFYYLLILFGTRTALFGSILVIFVYGMSKAFLYLFQTKRINIKQLSLLGLVIVLLGGLAIFGGSNVFKRRANMKSLENTIIDPLTNKPSHLTGDLTDFVVEIKKDTLTVEMSNAQKRALLKTYKKVSEWNISNGNRRMQQLIYHHYLFLEEASAKTIFFGTGYLNNYAELTLEMEIPAFLYNFGVLGFILYFGPFLYIFIRMLILFFQKIKSMNIHYMMYLAGAGLSFVLSFLTGYVYFYVPSMLVVICLFLLLIKEREEIVK